MGSNTHMLATHCLDDCGNPNNKEVIARRNQFGDAVDLLYRQIGRIKNFSVGALICGDFNMIGESKEHAEYVKMHGERFCDLYKAKFPRANDPVYGNGYTYRDEQYGPQR